MKRIFYTVSSLAAVSVLLGFTFQERSWKGKSYPFPVSAATSDIVGYGAGFLNTTSAVLRFNGRKGLVVPQSGDYTAAQVGAEPAVPTGTTSQYYRGDKTWQTFPTIPAAQVNSDWNASSGVAQILNKPPLGGFALLTPGTLTNTDICTSNGTTIACTTPASTFLGATAQAADSAKLGGTSAATVVAGAAAGSTALQANQTITISGDGSGSGTTAITFTEAAKASVYQWDNWSPSDVAGTTTNAPSTSAASVAASGYVTFSNSGGTVTTTFTKAGKYLVSVGSSLASSATFTYARMFLNLGGTATRYIYRSPTIGSGDAIYSWDLSLCSTFLVSATANQTLTVLPTLELGKAGGSTSNYNAAAQLSAVYVGQ